MVKELSVRQGKTLLEGAFPKTIATQDYAGILVDIRARWATILTRVQSLHLGTHGRSSARHDEEQKAPIVILRKNDQNTVAHGP